MRTRAAIIGIMLLAAGLGCSRKKSSYDSSAPSATAGEGSGVDSASGSVAAFGTDPTQATININLISSSTSTLWLHKDADWQLAAGTTLTLACAVPPATATSACTVQTTAATGQGTMPRTCLTATGTVCQVSASGSALARFPVTVNGTLQVVLNIDLDQATGTTAVTQVDIHGNPVAAPTPAVPADVAGLKITSGSYQLTFCPGLQADVINNRFPDFTTCTGAFTTHQYLNFTAGSSKSWPNLELWRSQEARDACMVGTAPIYQLTDGTNTYTPTLDGSGRLDAANLKTALIANAWLPAAAALRLSLADASLGPTTAALSTDTLRAAAQSAYPDQTDFCKALAVNVKTAWDAATLTFSLGLPSCKGVAMATASKTINAAFNDGADLLGRCGAYKSGRGGYTIGRFLTECNGSLFGAPGAQIQAQAEIQVLDQFLTALADTRHHSGSDRFVGLRGAFGGLPADLASLDSASSTYDTPLAAFLRLFAGLTSESLLHRAAGLVTASMGSAVNSPDKTLSQFNDQKGRSILIGWLQDSTRQAAIKQQLCSDAAADLTAAFQLVRNDPTIATLAADFDQPTTAGGTPTLKSSVSQATLCTDAKAALTVGLAASGLSVCSKTTATSSSSALTASCAVTTYNGALGQAALVATWTAHLKVISATLLDPAQDSTAMFSKDSSVTYAVDNTYSAAMAKVDYAALTNQVTTRLSSYPEGAALLKTVTALESTTTDYKILLYRLTHLLLDLISRDSFQSDPTFQNLVVTLIRQSKCPLAGTLLHDPVPATGGGATRLVQVTSPVLRTLSVALKPATNTTAKSPLYQGVDQRLVVMGDCTALSRQDLDNFAVDSAGNLTFTLSEAFAPCNLSTTAKAQKSAWLHFVKAVPVSN